MGAAANGAAPETEHGRPAKDHRQPIGALLILARNQRGLADYEDVDLATAAEDILDTTHQGDRQVHASLRSDGGDIARAHPPEPGAWPVISAAA
jgi:hypothetical protein